MPSLTNLRDKELQDFQKVVVICIRRGTWEWYRSTDHASNSNCPSVVPCQRYRPKILNFIPCLFSAPVKDDPREYPEENFGLYKWRQHGARDHGTLDPETQGLHPGQSCWAGGHGQSRPENQSSSVWPKLVITEHVPYDFARMYPTLWFFGMHNLSSETHWTVTNCIMDCRTAHNCWTARLEWKSTGSIQMRYKDLSYEKTSRSPFVVHCFVFSRFRRLAAYHRQEGTDGQTLAVLCTALYLSCYVCVARQKFV